MSPTRIGLIGLSALSDVITPGVWAGLVHLPYLQSSPEYEVVALCNTSVDSARRAIALHKLSDTTKAYGSPEDLANDPDVDMVVCSVRVMRHFELTKPSILMKKDVFIEWPLGANVAEAEELTRLAKASGVRTIVGLQARAEPLLSELKKIINDGKIGKVISTCVLGTLLPPVWLEGADYYLDMKNGGGDFYISFGHFLDSFVNVLGDFTDLQSTLKNQWLTLPIYNTEGQLVDPARPKNIPDHIAVQGILENGAMASLNFRKPVSTVDNIAIRWLITGNEGEIEVTSAEPHWQLSPPSLKLRLKIGTAEEAEEISFLSDEDTVASNIQLRGANVARIYDAFTTGDESHFATFESATKLHKLLDKILRNANYDLGK